MTRRRTEKPATKFRTHGGGVASTGGAPTTTEAPVLPEWHMDGVMAAYRIATYEARDRAAWRSALDVLELGPEARAVASDNLEWYWRRGPSEPVDYGQTVYPPGRAPLLVFTPG